MMNRLKLLWSGQRDQNPIEREARAWLIRLQGGQVTPQDAAAFRQWCAQGPEHAASFAQARLLWQDMGQALARQAAQAPRPAIKSPARRYFIGGAVAATAAAVWLKAPGRWWDSPLDGWGVDFHTSTGEQRELDLAQGTTLRLNTQTSVNRLATAGISLVSGEVELSTASAMTVHVDGGWVRAQNAAFNLRRIKDEVCVTCLQGQVEVNLDGKTMVLGAAQQLLRDKRGQRAPVVVDTAEVSAWRRGVLVFRDTPLSVAVEEINRYRPGKLVVMSDALSRRRLDGRFPIEALGEVQWMLHDAYGAKVTSLPGGIVLLA